MMAEKEKWHLDRKVPITLVVMILVQTGGAFWWASNIESNIETLQKEMAEQKVTDQRQYDVIGKERERREELSKGLARMEGLLESIDKQLARMNDNFMKQR